MGIKIYIIKFIKSKLSVRVTALGKHGFTLPEIMIAVALAGTWSVMIASAMKNYSDSYRRTKALSGLGILQKTIYDLTQDEFSCRRALQGSSNAMLSAPPAALAPVYVSAPPNNAGRTPIILYDPSSSVDGTILFRANPSSPAQPSGNPALYSQSRFSDILLTNLYFQNISPSLIAASVPGSPMLGAADLIFEFQKFTTETDPTTGLDRIMQTPGVLPDGTAPIIFFSAPIRVNIVHKAPNIISCMPFNPGRIELSNRAGVNLPLTIFNPGTPDEYTETKKPSCGPNQNLTMDERAQLRCSNVNCPQIPLPLKIVGFGTVGSTPGDVICGP
ncbi:MAG: type II secretion system protein [Bdellovibrionota bacterium]